MAIDLNQPEALPQPSPPEPVRRVGTWIGLLAVVAGAIFGSNMFSVRDRILGSAAPDAAPAAASRVAGETPPDGVPVRTSLRSQPWWQDVTTHTGTGPTTLAPFDIDAGAIQWRVKWTCGSGRLLVQSPKIRKPVIDSACPQGEPGYAVQTGATTLQVTADGPWRIEIAQQIDRPLTEPLLAAMTAAGAAAVASGPFYNIDKTGTGRVTLYRQADGKYSIRLDDFYVSPNSDLEFRFSPLEAPRTSKDFMAAPSELVTMMDVTAGSLNYTVPASLDPTKFRSLVVWCKPINSAYAAVSLGPVR